MLESWHYCFMSCQSLHLQSQKCIVPKKYFAALFSSKINSRKTKVASFYLDIKELGNYWGCDEDVRR